MSIRLPQLVICIAWVASIHICTEWWYRMHEGKKTVSQNWTIVLPEHKSGFRSSELPDEVRSILRYSEGTSALFDWPDGRAWNVIVLQWDAGRSSAQLATMHRPEICMPASGYGYIGPTQPLSMEFKGVKLTFDGSVFDSNGQPLYVYRCLWEEQADASQPRERRFDMSVHGRLMSSWHGRRNLGQRLVQIAVSGVSNEEEARDDIMHRFPDFITAGT